MDPATGLVLIALCGTIWYVLVYFEHIFGYSQVVDHFNQTFMYPLTVYISFYKYTILYIMLWIYAYQKKHRMLAIGLILVPFLDIAIAKTYAIYPQEQFAFLRFRHFR